MKITFIGGGIDTNKGVSPLYSPRNNDAEGAS